MELHQIRSACFTCRDPCSNDQQIAVCCKTLFEGGCHRSVEKCIRISPAFFQYRMDTPDELKLTGNLVMRCDGYDFCMGPVFGNHPRCMSGFCRCNYRLALEIQCCMGNLDTDCCNHIRLQ